MTNKTYEFGYGNDTCKMKTGSAFLYGYVESRIKVSRKVGVESMMVLQNGGQECRCNSDTFSSKVIAFSYAAGEATKDRVFMNACLSKSGHDDDVDIECPLEKVILDMPDIPVVVGIDWTPEFIRTYVDGRVIRHMDNE